MKFLALTLGTTVTVMILGYMPTIRLAGEDAISSMVAGCCISLVASVIGVIPVILARRSRSGNVPMSILASTVLRFFVALVLALTVALSDWLKTTPLLIWVSVSYLVLLFADTFYAVRLSKSGSARKE